MKVYQADTDKRSLSDYAKVAKGIWITWEIQRRNKGITKDLKWPLYEITHPGSKSRRYLHCMKKTIQVILKERPNIVVAQNPSVVLATLVVMMKKVFGYRAVIDAHNSGIYPREGKSNFMMQISRRLQRLSDLTIVTNDHLRQVVESNGGRAVVLPDSLPDVPEIRPYCQCRFKMSPFCRNKMSPDCRFHSERFSGSGCSSSPFGEGPNMPAFRFSLSR